MTTLEVINFYSSRDDYGYMSNFARYPVKVDGKVYKTSEHYYQSMKFEGTEYENKICEVNRPMDAATLGRDRSLPLRKDWESVKDNVMRKVVEAKFRQHDDIRDELLATGDAILVEHTTNDSYWADGGDGSGKNMLGIILMEVRAIFRAERESVINGSSG